ncbi:MAG: hypothetical protein VW405_02885 [Rhodospirillaceae bacterium]
MAAGSKRETILANIVTTLDAITTGGGYNTNSGTITRKWVHPSEWPSGSDTYWACSVQPGRESRLPDTESGAGMFRARFPVEMWITDTVTRTQQETGGISTRVEEIQEDVEKALMVDETRGFTPGQTEIETTEIEYIDAPDFVSEVATRVYFVIEAVVTYREWRDPADR